MRCNVFAVFEASAGGGMMELIVGICCEYCIKFESGDCPVINADSWSRHKNFCSEFENGEGDNIKEAFEQIFIEERS